MKVDASGRSLALALLGVPVRITCDDRELGARLALCYGGALPGEVEAGALEAGLRRSGPRWRIEVAGREPREEADPIEALRALHHELVHGVMRRAPELFFVHAAVVAWRERGIVLPGLSRSGKSTLALALVLEGARLVSDELLAFDPERTVARAFPRAFKIRDECLDYFPELAGRFVGAGEGRFLPFDALPAPVVAARVRPEVLVVPRWSPQASSRPIPLARGEALLALTASALNFGTHRERSLEHLTGLVARATCLRLDWAEPRAAARALLAELGAR